MFADPSGPQTSAPDGGRAIAERRTSRSGSLRMVQDASGHDRGHVLRRSGRRSAAGTLDLPDEPSRRRTDRFVIVTPVATSGAPPSARRRAERHRRQLLVEGDRTEGLRRRRPSCAAESDGAAAALAAAIGDFGSLPSPVLRAARGSTTDHRRRGTRTLDLGAGLPCWSTLWRVDAHPCRVRGPVPAATLRQTERERLTAGSASASPDGIRRARWRVLAASVALLAAEPTGSEADDTSSRPRAQTLHRPSAGHSMDRTGSSSVNAGIGATQLSVRRCSSADHLQPHRASTAALLLYLEAVRGPQSVSPSSTTCAATDTPRRRRYDAPRTPEPEPAPTTPPGVAPPAIAPADPAPLSCPS